MIGLLGGLLGCTPSPPAVVLPTGVTVDTVDTGDPYDPYASGLVGDPVAGAEAFRLQCATCHGPLGHGGLGADLRTVVPRTTDLELYRIIIHGNGGAMPAINVADPQEAVDIVAWLRSSLDPGEAR